MMDIEVHKECIKTWTVTLKDVKEFSELNKIDDANSLLINSSSLTLFMSICIHVSRARNVDNYFCNTALMWCCANGETNICLKLIEEFNANPFIEDKCKKEHTSFTNS